MSKKTLFSLLATILGVSGVAQSATSKIEISIGGNNTEFPESSKGFLVVDTAGDGFDFTKSNTILENKSDSVAGSKWGDDDIVVLVGLATVAFPDVGRGFNVAPKEADSSPAHKSWKSGDKLALVWFPEGASAKGKSYSYYTSNKIDSDRGTNAFEMPEDGAVDSIVAVGVTPTERGIVASSFTGTPLSSANVPPNSDSAPPKKAKKGKLTKKTSVSKSANPKSKLTVRNGAKKTSTLNSLSGRISNANKGKKFRN
jgi:hypothetical protein